MNFRVIGLLLAVALGVLGCRFFGGSDGTGSPVSAIPPVSTDPIRTTGNANLVVLFKVPGRPITPAVGFVANGNGTGGTKRGILADPTAGEIRVSFILKIIHPGHPELPYTELKREVPVVGGVATITFSGLPPESTIGRVDIIGGKKDNFTEFHGGVDLVDDATNTLVVSPVGSAESAAQVAQVILDMVAKPADFLLIQPKVVTSMESALIESQNRVGSGTATLLANVRMIYISQNSSATADISQELDGMKEFMTSYSTYKDRAYEGQSIDVASAIPSSIRAAINAWNWDPERRIWTKFVPGVEENRRYGFFYGTETRARRFQYITDSPAIDRLVTVSELRFSSGSDKVLMTDTNEYIFGSAMQKGTPWFDHVGLASATVNGVPVFEITSDLRYCDMRANYPGIGWVNYDNKRSGVQTRFFFDGTCVMRIVRSTDSSQTAGYRYIEFQGGTPAPRSTSAAIPAPAFPPANVAVIPTHSSVKVSWDQASGATSYDLYYSASPSKNVYDMNRIPFVSSPYFHPVEVPPATFSFRLVARSPGGESPPSEPVFAHPLPPPVPTGLTAMPGDGNVFCRWDPAVFGPASDEGFYQYRLFWSTSTEPTNLSSRLTPSTFFLVPGLENGTRYYFSVAAVSRASATSPLSAIASAVPGLHPPLPPPVASASARTRDGAVFDWTWPPRATGFQWFVTGPDIPDIIRDKVFEGATQSWRTPVPLKKGAKVEFFVRSLRDSEVSSYSKVVAVTIPGYPPPPEVEVIPHDQFNTISWKPVPGAEGYNLYWATNSSMSTESAAKIASVTSPFDHKNLTNGTRYFYLVTTLPPKIWGNPTLRTW